MEDKFFTIEEVTEYLKIPKSTIYKLSERGDLPSCKIGKQLRFRESSLDRWLTEKEAGHSKGKFTLPFKNKEIKPKAKFVLLIEDDRLVLKALLRFLEIYGYKVTPCESGEEALEKVEKSGFDLIITDIKMPGMDGIETIKKIREFCRKCNRPNIPEIIITGYTDGKAVQEAEGLGITDYIYKPFANSDFIKIVKRRLEQVAGLN